MPKTCWCGNADLKDYNEDYCRCDSCHTLVNRKDFDAAFDHVKDEKKDLYGAHYWTENFLKLAEVATVSQLHDRYLTERTLYWLQYLLRHLLPPASVAEIGCGMGQFPYLLRQAGFRQVAFELSPEICQYGRENFGLDMVCGTIDDRLGDYDGIILMDLIEHIADLNVFMQSVLQHTSKDTLLFIQTPCYTPGWTIDQMLGREPNFRKLLDSNQHIFLFSKDSMRRLLAQYGYGEIQFYPPFFGEHYDMFLVAGKTAIPQHGEEEIQQALTQAPGVWLVRALLKQFREIRETMEQHRLLVQSKDNYIRILEERSQELEGYLRAEKEAFEEERAFFSHREADLVLQKQSLEQQLDKASRPDPGLCQLAAATCLTQPSLGQGNGRNRLNMRIGINLVALFPGNIGGAEQYVRNVIEYLETQEGVTADLFLNEHAFPTFEESEKIRKHLINLYQDMPTQLNFFIDECNLDVWFCPLFDLDPYPCRIPTVTSLLDIQQEYYPENFSRHELAHRKQSVLKTTTNSHHLLTISEYSKQTIVEKFQVPPGHITVTYLNSDASFDLPIDPGKKDKVRRKYELPASYLLYPANSWPHKNHNRLLQAYAKLKAQGFSHKLVLTGAKKESQEGMDSLIRTAGIQDDVLYLGYIAQEDMPYIFANAFLLVFPSLFEGFGIPLLEAMRVGVPIAASNLTCIPEICQDSALYFDPFSVEDIAEKITTLAADPALQVRLVENGRKRAQDFSWKKCAEETICCLEAVYHGAYPQGMPAPEKNPLVSIITPSYNQGEFIRETIESVLNQDYPNIEYIVMDGGSTDETVEILKSYGDRIQWVSEKDGGQADAVNKGIARARGKFIGWLNSDDTYMPGAVAHAVTYLEARPTVDAVYAEGYYIDRGGQIIDRYSTEKHNIHHLAETCYICQPTVFLRKSILEKLGGLDASLHMCMDYDLWIRIAFAGHMAYTPHFWATSRMYEENKTLSRKGDSYAEIFKTVSKYYKYLPMSWIFGYVDYRFQGKRTPMFWLTTYLYFWWYNRTRKRYALTFVYRGVRHKVGKALRSLLRKN